MKNSYLQSDEDDGAIALVVDLDGTLCCTDTLHEALLVQIKRKPWLLLSMPSLAARGRTVFKSELANSVTVPAGSLPLNESVLEALRAARAAGRRTALVSASDHRQVAAVAESVGLFDEAHGSTRGYNLKGSKKAAFLIDRFGEKRFDYVGDARADRPVWRAARKAITVRAGQRARRVAEEANPRTLHLDPPVGRGRAMLKAMRPHQWLKNAILFLPLIAAHNMTGFAPVVLGFLAFCLTASAVYVINDLLDLAADRAHPRKKRRPFASGDLSITTGVAMSASLITVAIALGLATVNLFFLIVLAAYIVVTFSYSFFLKHKLLIDVLTLAGLYTIRIIAGGAAGGVHLSPWMLGFSMFFFLSLAAVKRQAELTDQATTRRISAGRAYEVNDLPLLLGVAISASQSAVLVLALYISSEDVRVLYAFPGLIWLICPLLLYWSLRMVMKTHRGHMTDDPVVFAATDLVSIALIILCLLIGLAAAFWPWAIPMILTDLRPVSPSGLR